MKRDKGSAVIAFIAIVAGIAIMVLPASANEAKIPDKSTQVEARRQELGKNLLGYGSFSAEFLALKNKDPKMRIRLVLDHERKYALLDLMKIEGKVPPVSLVIVVLDYRQDPKYIVVDPIKKTIGQTSVSDLINDPVNPMSILWKVINSVLAEEKQRTLDVKKMNGFPVISMGLGKETLDVGLGVSSELTSPAFSWLSEDRFDEPERIERQEHVIVIQLSDEQTVTINNNTGMLERDLWREENGDERELELLSLRKSNESGAYEAHYGKLGELTPGPSLPAHLEKEFYLRFLTDLGRELGARRNLEETLAERKDEISDMAFQLAREHWFSHLRTEGEKAGVREFAYYLIKMYKEFNEKEERDITLKEYIKILTESFIMRKSLMDAFIGNEDTFRQVIRYGEYIAQLPQGAQEPLKTIYELITPSYKKGMALAFIDATIAHIQENMDQYEDTEDAPSQ